MGPHVKVLYGYLCQYLSVRSAVVQYSGFPSPSSFPPPLVSAPLFPLSSYLSFQPFIHVQLLAFCCKRQYSSESRGYGPLMGRFVNCINLPKLERLKKKKHTHTIPFGKFERLARTWLSLLWPSRTLCSGNVASSSGLDLLPNFALFESNSHFKRVQKWQYLALGRIGFFRISLK